jgi:hypothetical protein
MEALIRKGEPKDLAMDVLTWREVDFEGVVVAGLIAGYVMALAGLWAGKVPGLVSFDIADYGRRYMVSDRPSAWLLGFVSHLLNSVLLVFVWASLIEPNLPWPRPFSGLAWGCFLLMTLAGSIVMPLSGAGFMGRKTHSPRLAITAFLLHTVWGLLIGFIYVPRP